MAGSNRNSSRTVAQARSRFIVTATVMIMILSLTVATLFVVRTHTEQRCWAELKSATEAADVQMTAFTDNTFAYLENMGILFGGQADPEGREVADEVSRCRIGDMQMEMRMYFPDGKAFTASGIIDDVTSQVRYSEILDSLDGENRYISCVRYDYINPEMQVMEFFAPVKQNGRTAALISAVMDVKALQSHIVSSAYGGKSYIYCVDVRDGTFFLDTDHKTVMNSETFRNRVDKHGKSNQAFFEGMMTRQEVSCTLISERYNVPAYLYSIPSKASSNWSVMIGVREATAFASVTFVRTALVGCTIAEVIVFAAFLFWLTLSVKRESAQIKRTAGQVAAKALENNTRILALEDDFVSLYDVDLETGQYSIYVKKHLLSEDKIEVMENNNDFFGDTVRNAEKVVYAEDRADVVRVLSLDFIRATLENGNSYDWHYRLNTGDRPVWARMRFTYKDSERTHLIVGVFNAENEMNAKQLKDVRRTMNMIFSLADEFDPVIVFDPETGEYDWYNSKASEIERDTPMSMHGKNIYADLERTCDTVIHEDDREQFRAFYTVENMMKIARTGEGQEIENRWFVGVENRYLWKYNKVVRMSDEMGNVYIVVGVVDTTGAKEREALLEEQQRQLNSALDLANQQRHIKAFGDMVNAALWGCNINDDNEVTEVIWSNEFRRMFGYAETEAAFPSSVESWSDLLHPGDRERTLEYFHSALESRDTEKFVYDAEYRIKRKTGEYCWYHSVGRMEYNDDGSRKLYGIINDISAEKKLEAQQKELQKAFEMAESANRAKTAFLFNMSHDIRTPMNAILGYADMSLSHLDNREAVHEYLHKLKSSGEHLLNLINDILEMSRIEAGKLEIVSEPMDIRDSVERVRNIGQALAMPKNISFTVDAGELANPYLLSDELHIDEVMINILSNAMKYTNEDGTVTYSVRQISDASDGKARFRFEVTDNGIGMSEEFQKHIFETFTREKTTTVSKQEGTGLGLSIVKRIVDLAGGTVGVKSRLGEGTTVTVELPLTVMDDETAEQYRSEHENAPSIRRSGQLKGCRVLLVEDNEMNREIAQDILSDEGMIIEAAEDGDVAVRMAAEKGVLYYDFILMDIQMPVMNGYDATRAIRELPDGSKIPIIAVSANAFEEDRRKSLEAGMNAHIAKPIRTDELFRVVAKFLQ